MEAFDLLGELPTGPGTTVLEASAGTGKTFTLAGLVTRYMAEGRASLDEMLLITFGRAASQELRERVRDQLVEAARALDDPALVGDNTLLAALVAGTPGELEERRRCLRDALAGFDAATIATTHQFCQLVLRSLGVAGDTDAGVTLVESLDDLVTESRRRPLPAAVRPAARGARAEPSGGAAAGARGGAQSPHRAATDRSSRRLTGRRPTGVRPQRLRRARTPQAQARRTRLRRSAEPPGERPWRTRRRRLGSGCASVGGS